MTDIHTRLRKVIEVAFATAAADGIAHEELTVYFDKSWVTVQLADALQATFSESGHTWVEEDIDYFKILPSINSWHTDLERIGKGVKVDSNFTYRSDNNKEWMTVKTLTNWIDKNQNKIGNI